MEPCTTIRLNISHLENTASTGIKIIMKVVILREKDFFFC